MFPLIMLIVLIIQKSSNNKPPNWSSGIIGLFHILEVAPKETSIFLMKKSGIP